MEPRSLPPEPPWDPVVADAVARLLRSLGWWDLRAPLAPYVPGTPYPAARW